MHSKMRYRDKFDLNVHISPTLDPIPYPCHTLSTRQSAIRSLISHLGASYVQSRSLRDDPFGTRHRYFRSATKQLLCTLNSQNCKFSQKYIGLDDIIVAK